jgi:hypothetical protein
MPGATTERLPARKRALVTLTPAVAGKKYFEDIAAVVNAGGPPDMAKVKAVMEKYGLIVA